VQSACVLKHSLPSEKAGGPNSRKFKAQALAKVRGWNWPQNYLGDSSDMARQLAISSAPTYFLVGNRPFAQWTCCSVKKRQRRRRQWAFVLCSWQYGDWLARLRWQSRSLLSSSGESMPA
jgi:hypothetical protein